MKKVLKSLARLLAALLVLVLLAVAALLILPLTEKVDSASVPASADWMAELPDGRLLSERTIPGTHDTGTQYVQLAFVAKCQALGVRQQLEAGYRYLDIRLGSEQERGELRLMHGFTACKTGAFTGKDLLLDQVLDECCAFLAEHPTETVLFAVKQEHGDEPVADFEKKLDGYIRKTEDRWLLTDTIPTLGEARGKLVLLRRYEDEAGLGVRAGVPLLWENQNGHGDVSLNAAAEDEGAYTLWVQDRYEYGAEDKWNAFCEGMNAARDRLPGDVALHFLSTKGTAAYGHPYRFAQTLNDRLMRANLALDGWVIVDFDSARLAEVIYSAN